MEIAEIVKLIIVVMVLMTILLAVAHFWVFICDTLFGGIKRLFGFKKKTINWHTLDETNVVKEEDMTTKTHDVDDDHKHL